MTFTSSTPDSTCDRCWYYAGLSHCHCVQHPEGVLGIACPGFEVDPEVEAFQAMTWVAEEPGHYNGDRVEQPEDRWSDERRLELLNWHPMFTGHCPECERPIHAPDIPVHWDCPWCGWRDDSV